MLAFAVLTLHPASAQDAPALAAELRALRLKVEQLELRLRHLQESPSPAPPTNDVTPQRASEGAVSTADSSGSVSNQQAHATQACVLPKVTIGENGVSVSSADESFKVALRGTFQFDSRTTLNDGHPSGNKGFLVRRAQPILQGAILHDFDFLFVTDFGGTGDPQIVDAVLNYRSAPWLQLKAGKFKPPFGLEQLQSEKEVSFNERAFPSSLVPNRDLGTQLHGVVANGRANYAAGLFSGAGDSRVSNNSGFDMGGSFDGRVFVEPFRGAGSKPLGGLGFGLGGSYAFMQETNSHGLATCYGTPSQHPFFTFRAGTVAEDCHWRTTPQARYSLGPLSLLSEFTVSHQDVAITESGAWHRATLNNTAWQLSAGWVLSGEDADWAGLSPRNAFNPKTGSWGAWQLVVRYAAIHLDDSAFPHISDPSTSSDGAHEWAAGVNWYWNHNLRISGSYSHVTFDHPAGGGAAASDPGDENTLFTRISMTF